LHEIHQGPLVNDLAFAPDSAYLHAAADDGMHWLGILFSLSNLFFPFFYSVEGFDSVI
jgi:hypothetical protein